MDHVCNEPLNCFFYDMHLLVKTISMAILGVVHLARKTSTAIVPGANIHCMLTTLSTETKLIPHKEQLLTQSQHGSLSAFAAID